MVYTAPCFIEWKEQKKDVKKLPFDNKKIVKREFGNLSSRFFYYGTRIKIILIQRIISEIDDIEHFVNEKLKYWHLQWSDD